MSFSYNAASIDNNYELSPNSLSETSIHKKKLLNQHKKTQRQPHYDSNKVNAVVQNIQNQTPKSLSSSESTSNKLKEGYASMADSNNNLGNFRPLDMPISAGQERMSEQEVIGDSKEGGIVPNGTIDSTLIYNEMDESHDLDQNFMTKQQSKQYYRNLMGNYPNTNTLDLSTSPQHHASSNDIVVTKLNYLIDLMEEQQSEKTDSVVEDIVLYSFLGVFVIFVVDSFVKVGKYVR